VRAGAAIEIATGLALLVIPSLVRDALIGSPAADAPVVDRVLGGALLALGIAGALTGPGRTRARDPRRVCRLQRVDRGGTCFRWFRSDRGVLLWPTSALHAFIAVQIASHATSANTRRVTRPVTLVPTTGTKH
jgi:hypothetical protein